MLAEFLPVKLSEALAGSAKERSRITWNVDGCLTTFQGHAAGAHPVYGCPPILSTLERLAKQLADKFRIGLAARRFHRLADQESERRPASPRGDCATTSGCRARMSLTTPVSAASSPIPPQAL